MQNLGYPLNDLHITNVLGKTNTMEEDIDIPTDKSTQGMSKNSPYLTEDR